MIGLLACTSAGLHAAYTAGEWTPAGGRVAWDGPAGVATLRVDDGPDGAWRTVAMAEVEAGSSSLPLALVPEGAWRWELAVDDGHASHIDTGRAEIPPPPIPAATLEALDPRSAFAAGGYWVGYTFGFRWRAEDAVPIVVDGHGRVVWWAPPDPDGGLVMRVRPSVDGRSILVLEDFEDGAARVVHRYGLDGTTRDTIATPDATHDFVEDADGSITWIAYERSETELVPGQPAPTVADVILTRAGDGAPSRGFSFFDDYPRDPWHPCAHADWDLFVPEAAEWSHANTLIRDGDGWIVGVRHFDAILGVRDHERVWQVGGEDATVLADGEGTELHHPHLAEAWTDEDGVLHLLVFDNGTHLPAPVVSRVVELAVEDGMVRVVWEHGDPEGRYTGFLGDAHRLPGGDTLIGWTEHGELEEVTPAGEVVWRWTFPGPLGRGVFAASLHP